MAYSLDQLMNEDVDTLIKKCPAVASTFLPILDQIIQACRDKGRQIEKVKVRGVVMDD